MAEIPNELKASAAEYDQNVKDQSDSYDRLEQQAAAIKSMNFTKDENKLRSMCINLAQTQLAILNDEKPDGEKEIKKLSPLMVAYLFEKAFHYGLFDTGENARIAFYQPTTGTYTRNARILYRYISWFEPMLTKNQADNVIFSLTNRAPHLKTSDDENYIAVGNGLFNIKTKKLEGFTPEHHVFTKISTDYVDAAPEPNYHGWTVDKMFNELACNDKEEVTLFWQIINDALNGNRSRGKAFFLVGNVHGNNGKGTFQTLIENVVGKDNYSNLKVEDFEKRFALSDLDGKSVCIGDDIQNQYIEQTSNFNSIVTGDSVNLEVKGKPIYKAKLHCTIIQSCNTMPTFGKQGGTMRRLILVPFHKTFYDHTENKRIKDDYLNRKAVKEYVLYKALHDYADFDHFTESARCKSLKNEFEADNNSLVGFYQDVFKAGNFDCIPTRLTFDWYTDYCKKNGFTPIRKPKRFTRQFSESIEPDYEKIQSRINHEAAQQIINFNELCKSNHDAAIWYELKLANGRPQCYVKKIINN